MEWTPFSQNGGGVKSPIYKVEKLSGGQPVAGSALNFLGSISVDACSFDKGKKVLYQNGQYLPDPNKAGFTGFDPGEYKITLTAYIDIVSEPPPPQPPYAVIRSSTTVVLETTLTAQ